MTNPRSKPSTDHDATAEVRAWVAGRLRFERLLASLEREAGFMGETDPSRRP